jgi:polar amino acid transport system substrate-binding protein
MCLAFLLLLLPAIASAETITLVADEWPPFNGVPNSSEEGFLVDVARAVFEAQGIKVAYSLLPWRRAVTLTHKGNYNGLIGASKTDAPDFIFPAEELSRNVLAFYVRTDSTWTFTQRSDIERVSLGVISGYDYRQWLLDYIAAHGNAPEKIQVMTGHQPLERNIKKLLGHRVDAIVDNEAVILYVARRMGVRDQIKPAGYGSEPAYIYIAFSPAHPDSRRYAQLLSDGIVDLRHRGRLAAILSKYGLTDWK